MQTPLRERFACFIIISKLYFATLVAFQDAVTSKSGAIGRFYKAKLLGEFGNLT